MVHVIASVQVKPGKVSEFLKIFKANVPLVRAEKGCIQYVPTVDIRCRVTTADHGRKCGDHHRGMGKPWRRFATTWAPLTCLPIVKR